MCVWNFIYKILDPIDLEKRNKTYIGVNLMFIGLYIIVIVEE